MFRKVKMYLTRTLFFTVLATLPLGLIYKTIAQEDSSVITIYHTNDLHGNVDSCYNPDGKLLQIGVDVIKSMKHNTPNSILVDAGDFSQGSALASHSKGKKIIELMNVADYDVVALGNHEFDYGIMRLRGNIELAEFPIISANVLNDDGSPFLKKDTNNGCNLIKEINGKRIGFFAVNTTETVYKTNPDNVKGIRVEDEIKISREQVNELKNQNVDLIVAIAHMGNSPSSKITSRELAKSVKGIDIIIDGHSHEEYTLNEGNTVIQQIGTGSKKIGKFEIEFTNNEDVKISPEVIKAGDLIDPSNPGAYQFIPDINVKKLCDEALEEISVISKTVIGNVGNGLYGGNYEKTSICRLGDTNLGNLMGDALLKEAERLLDKSGIPPESLYIVSLQNGGGVRDSISAGMITVGDVLRVFPFENTVSVKRVVPKQLYEILENGVKSMVIKDGVLYGSDGAFANTGGMRYEFDINDAPIQFNDKKDEILSSGSRIKKIVLLNDDGTDKKILDRNDTQTEIAFISNSFETSGGDQYIMLKDIPYLTDDGNALHIILSDYIKKLTLDNGGKFNYHSNYSRVKLVGAEEIFDKFDVIATIKENSALLKNKAISISIDGGEKFETTTNLEGEIIISGLEPGPHDITFSRGSFSMNNYVNSYLGITKASVFLENKSNYNINNVINIINGIERQPQEDKGKYIQFARMAYQELKDEERPQVNNYDVLLLAENNTLSNSSNDFMKNNKAIIIGAASLFLIGICVFTRVYFKKKKIQ